MARTTEAEGHESGGSGSEHQAVPSNRLTRASMPPPSRSSAPSRASACTVSTLPFDAGRDGAGGQRDRIGVGRDADGVLAGGHDCVMVGEIGRRGFRMNFETAHADLAISHHSHGK